jgi:hypothetical protein
MPHPPFRRNLRNAPPDLPKMRINLIIRRMTSRTNNQATVSRRRELYLRFLQKQIQHHRQQCQQYQCKYK